ncbi:ATP-binding protein [Simiaoa sunii]|uniref:ATP-binding protein n=1 Tax=Simiaoa sunii TaxID=2763672 RepID=A0A7G9FUL3_9FIRM|nr:ATP-binding protein [Simiaoa sunii]QNM02245.1 ATP-binding protein [Simiaoa sunii]RHQ75386.1 ATP-binding protein [Firmicutes bacterium AF22-6AC]
MIARPRYMKIIKDFMDKPVIKVITGMRRSGKSALLELTKQELLNIGKTPDNIIYINFESLRYEYLKEYRALYQHLIELGDKTTGKLYILLDEIQEVDGWQQVINSLRVDMDCDIYVTGSNARLLSGELATLLAGRYVEIRVYPLDFKEYLKFAETNEGEAGLTRQEHFANYVRFGGLPGIHQMTWEEDRIIQYLQDIYNSVLLKDVIARNNIRDTVLLENIVKYIMDNIGNTFSAKTISDFLKSQGRKLSTETVYNYLKALANAFLIAKVARFDIKGKKILETQEKYYLSDLGIRHAVMGYRDNDIAGVLENIVYLELLRREYAVNIGKQGTTEVDFVANRRDERLYVQVCYILTPENTNREFAPLEAIADNYEKMILSMDSLLHINRGGIRQKNILDFLLENEKIF